MKSTYHVPAMGPHPVPKRGDLIQSNIGTKRERTWFVLAVKTIPERVCPELGGILTRRYKLWAERWWEIEPETRVRLFQSAERAGGQHVHPFVRFQRKPAKRSFEQYMAL